MYKFLYKVVHYGNTYNKKNLTILLAKNRAPEKPYSVTEQWNIGQPLKQSFQSVLMT